MNTRHRTPTRECLGNAACCLECETSSISSGPSIAITKILWLHISPCLCPGAFFFKEVSIHQKQTYSETGLRTFRKSSGGLGGVNSLALSLIAAIYLRASLLVSHNRQQNCEADRHPTTEPQSALRVEEGETFLAKKKWRYLIRAQCRSTQPWWAFWRCAYLRSTHYCSNETRTLSFLRNHRSIAITSTLYRLLKVG